MKIKKLYYYLFAAALMLLLCFNASAQYSNVMVFYNGTEIDFGENGAYYDAAYKTVMAPLEAVAEAMGAETTVDTETGAVNVTKAHISITMILGDKNVMINSDRQVELPTPPVMQDDRIFIPLDFLANALHYDYTFKADSLYASIETRLTYELGVSFAEMKVHLGEPDRMDQSTKGYQQYVYLNDYQNYSLIGVENDTVISCFVSGASWNMACGICGGMKLSTCESLMQKMGASSARDKNRMIYTLDDEIFTVFFDIKENIYAVFYEKSGYDSFSAGKFELSSATLELSDLVNCYRVINGCEPLTSDRGLASMAKAQANEMAETGRFGHKDADENDYVERMKAAGYGDCYVSEVVAEAYNDCFSLFSDLLTDESYRSIVLAAYDGMGCGIVYNENSEALMYYTQIFYAEKD